MNVRIRTTLLFARMDAMMLTTADLAEIIGISTKGMQGIINSGTCSPITLGKLAKVFGLEPWELML